MEGSSETNGVQGPGLARSAQPDYRGWRAALARGGYAGVLLVAVGVTYALIWLDADPALASGIVAFSVAVLIWTLERAQPYTPGWHPKARSFAIDLVHSLVSAYAVAPAVRAALVVGLATLRTDAAAPLWWPQTWPLVIQLALAVVVADFGVYLAHRFMHVTRVGWRMHCVHHSPKRLNFIASARSHPFNVALSFGSETGMLLVLGAPPLVMALWTVFKATNGLLQHSNVDLRPGRLSYLLATCDVHRWHHSVVREHSDTNFGNTTMVWDQVFRTFFMPPGRRAGTDIGIDNAEIPESYLAHLAMPFVLAKYESPPADRDTALSQ